MTDWIGRLWNGEESLPRVFWEYAILYGTIASLVASGLMYAALAADAPMWTVVVAYFLNSPYTVFVTVAVWRSAERYRGPGHWAHAARIVIVVWAILTIVT